MGGSIHQYREIGSMHPNLASVLVWFQYFPGWIDVGVVLGVFHVVKDFLYHRDWATLLLLPLLDSLGAPRVNI